MLIWFVEDPDFLADPRATLYLSAIQGPDVSRQLQTPMISFPLNFRGIIAIAVGLIIMTIIYIKNNSREKKDYAKTTGEIVYLDKRLGELPSRDVGKYRYLKLQGYPYPFEIFVGKDPGDFGPKYEQIDHLQPGNIVSVFYYETDNTHSEKINRYIQFIDKGEISFFERGDSQRTLGVFMIGFCGLLIAGAFTLWKLKKIEF